MSPLLAKGFNNIYFGTHIKKSNELSSKLKVMLNSPLEELFDIHELFDRTVREAGFNNFILSGGIVNTRLLHELWTGMVPAVIYLEYELWKFSKILADPALEKTIELVTLRAKLLIYLFLKQQNEIIPLEMMHQLLPFFSALPQKYFKACLADLSYAKRSTRELIISSLEVILLRCYIFISRIFDEIFTGRCTVNIAHLTMSDLLPNDFATRISEYEKLKILEPKKDLSAKHENVLFCNLNCGCLPLVLLSSSSNVIQLPENDDTNRVSNII